MDEAGRQAADQLTDPVNVVCAATPGGAAKKAAAGPVREFLKRVGKLLGRKADDVPIGGAGNLSGSALKSFRSLEQRAAEHAKKLADYRANPDAFDNLGLLKNAPTPEIRQRIIDGRIRHLEQEIKAFTDHMNKLLGGG